jgi:hypothetical protein
MVALDCPDCDTQFVLEGDDLNPSKPGSTIAMTGRKGDRKVRVRCPGCHEVLVYSEAEWSALVVRGGTDDALAALKEAEAAQEAEARSHLEDEPRA